MVAILACEVSHRQQQHQTVAAVTVGANARFADEDTSDGEPPPALFAASPATDVSFEATHDTESALQQEVDSLRAELLNAALRHEVEAQGLKDKLAELQVALWRYKLALVLAVLTVALLLTVITLGAAHAVTAYELGEDTTLCWVTVTSAQASDSCAGYSGPRQIDCNGSSIMMSGTHPCAMLS